MNRKVFQSLLALDSYNRGYDQSLFIHGNQTAEGQDELERWIGNARVIEQNITQSAQAAGFYAIAYELPDEVVISYRGTNFPNDPLDPTDAEVTALTADTLARNASVAC